MNNLLQSLSSQRLRVNVQDADLKRLLSAVKDGRGHDQKLSDSFYDSLEGILTDLRTITIDNHDAEAFLKPVSKTDYPDYYEIIKEPMDLQTMLRKVKQKQYKSKAEFSDDLELIWSNCSVYNTGDNHPLRLCAKRLQQKANRLLRNITDRKDRLDPPVPSEPRVNGVMVNGHSRKHSATPGPRPVVIKKPSVGVASRSETPPRREATFADSIAFVRTPTGMAEFLNLDKTLSLEEVNIDPEKIAGPSHLSVTDRLRQIVLGNELDFDFPVEFTNGDIGSKRKLVNDDFRPRKRSRIRSPSDDTDAISLWWEASRTSDLMANALPILTHSSSGIPSPALPPMKPARKKKKKPPVDGVYPPKTLLGLINKNIRTLKQIRKTHNNLVTLNAAMANDDGTGANMSDPPPTVLAEDAPESAVLVDEEPWRLHGAGLELSEREADECLHWTGRKILEHSGFQSTSKAALDVLSGVAAEFFCNVGRTLRFLSDKYSSQMSPEEIILHTLFESGITHVRDLDRYINDDIVRYGSRLGDLEKKLVNVYKDMSAESAMDDDVFFGEEDEEEDGELLMGNFADSLGDDFLGLRELGIAGELGLQNLTIPKKLLRTKNRNRNGLGRAKASEPPPPYPPPPPFAPLDSTHVDSQIGLLRNFYIKRLNNHSSRVAPTQPPPFITPPPQTLSALEIELARDLGTEAVAPQPEPTINPAAPNVILPDDEPQGAQTKCGPLGQIVRPSASSSQKKKPKPPKEAPQLQIPPEPVTQPPPVDANGAGSSNHQPHQD